MARLKQNLEHIIKYQNLQSIIFKECSIINSLIEEGKEKEARDIAIVLLYLHEIKGIEYTQLENHLLRELGLYPYIKGEKVSWQDRYAQEVFKTEVGDHKPAILHREQSRLLKLLLEGKNIAVSAPTSFGKSFVIDAFIAIKKPQNVVIIVPTIALMDETRRRLNRKFASEYEIITTTDAELKDKNILVFPQERALAYVHKLPFIDILIIDEFYKSSIAIDEERAPSLLNCIMHFDKIAKQKYYLAPNIDEIIENSVTKNMQFEKTDFQTVKLFINNKHNRKNPNKNKAFSEVIKGIDGKTLIYTSSTAEINKVQELMLDDNLVKNQNNSQILTNFANWVGKNYIADWTLANCIKKGIGYHHGKLHRSLSQLIVRMFEETNGLETVISTSSMIEGVNTSAKNVILWNNKRGPKKIDSFTYKNIIGRCGRMFKHFVGNIYLLDEMPTDKPTQLSLEFPNDMVIDENELKYVSISNQDKEKIQKNIQTLKNEIGNELYNKISKKLVSLKKDVLIDIVKDLKNNPKKWNGLNFILNPDTKYWDYLLKQFLALFGMKRLIKDAVPMIKICSNNWFFSLPVIIKLLRNREIDIDRYFELEKIITYNFASLLTDFNTIQKELLANLGVDLDPFIQKITYAFLPPMVFQLEEFGLPRMISRKIQTSGLINFEDPTLTMQKTLEKFNEIGCDRIKSIQSLDDFDKYIVDYFFEGIRKG